MAPPRVLQANLNHASAAQDLYLQTVAEGGFGLGVVSEPYRVPTHPNWLGDSSGRAAVVRGACEGSPPIRRLATGDGYVLADWGGLVVASCYISPNVGLDVFEEFLEALSGALAGYLDRRLIVAGDFNAKASIWGSRRTDARGATLRDWASDLGLLVVNVGSTGTCVRWQGESVIDVTFASSAAARGISGWGVLRDVFTHSDHRYIAYGVGWPAGRPPPARGFEGWSARQMDADFFDACMVVAGWPREEEVQQVRGLDEEVERLRGGLWAACEASMPRRKPKGRKALHWWSAEIAEARRETGRLWRRVSRAKRDGRLQEAELLRDDLRASKKALRILIRTAKEQAWAEFLRSLDRDPWGKPYKMVMGRLRPWTPPITETLDPAKVAEIVGVLFPDRPVAAPVGVPGATPWDKRHDVSEEEMVRALSRVGGIAKAPGPDRVPGVALSRAVAHIGGDLRGIFTRCLREGRFPEVWKTAHLVLIPKDGKPEGAPSSYRPICLLDEAGKALERVVAGRVNRLLATRGPKLSSRQYGFREGRSTTDAIRCVRDLVEEETSEGGVVVAVAIDIANAFNTLPWGRINGAVARSFALPGYLVRLIGDYLSARTLEWRDREGELRTRRLSCGVPQGSVLGPLLWNLGYDRVLRTPLPPRCHVICYADDTIVLAAGDDWPDAANMAERAVSKVLAAVEAMGLRAAPQKMEAMAFGGPGRGVPPGAALRIGGAVVELGPTIRYLGLWLDGRWGFAPHFGNLLPRVDGLALALARLLPNLRGPGVRVRRLYAAVVHSVLMYGAPVWAEDLARSAPLKRAVRAVQRRIASRVVRAYRTVSHGVVTALAGMMPADLLAGVYAEEYEGLRALRNSGRRVTNARVSVIRERARAGALREWSESIRDASARGLSGARTLEALQPVLAEWVERQHGRLTYHLTQLLTGHGCFSVFLKRIGKDGTDRCHHCDAERDTAEHTLRACDAWREQRRALTDVLGPDLSLPTVVARMVGSREAWDAMAEFAHAVMVQKEQAERERERTAAAAGGQ